MIGVFAHSTNPRGGVVHAMHLAEALCDEGVEAMLLAPGANRDRFFRAPRCASVVIPAAPAPDNVGTLVQMRRREIAAFLSMPDAPHFEILHVHDSISALALCDLAEAGLIDGFMRTVHHLDDFASPRLAAWQDEAVRRARHLFCVSQMWQSELVRRFRRPSTLVGNGVDAQHYCPQPGPRDAQLRARWLPQGGRMILAVGGVEARKNTLGILHAFFALVADGAHPDLHLLIAGGASLLDHCAARDAFAEALSGSVYRHRVRLLGVVDDEDMPALYRNAAMLCFPSLQEGFGLCVLEAMASGIPVIVPFGEPFDSYLADGDAIRVDPVSVPAITQAMARALQPGAVGEASSRGPARARRFDWRRVARAHLACYQASASANA
ncbi:MSMEG_0565 family glycosyltransferase [Lichenicoccus sp.]|uniref:MSMEG_0565 family glycosyltransferase n=1 Tax=Lichenicoccus sp. TaxID=2781899 RepID=UPI003D0DA1EA